MKLTKHVGETAAAEPGADKPNGEKPPRKSRKRTCAPSVDALPSAASEEKKEPAQKKAKSKAKNKPEESKAMAEQPPVESEKKAVPKHVAKKLKKTNAEEPPQVVPKPAVVAEKADSSQKTFARRYRTSANGLKFDALKWAFNETIWPCVHSPSKHEDGLGHRHNMFLTMNLFGCASSSN